PPGRWRARLLVAAAAACLVVAAVFGVQSVSAQREAAQAQQQLDQVLTVLSAPDARIATASAGDSVATAVVSPSTGRLAFLARNMPALDEDRSYQIWATGPNGRHSIGTLGAGQDPPPVIGALGGATDVAVTIEPRGGSPAPTTPTIMEFELPTT
ncbi:MAG TPA: anti-sigma factor, partial [Pseudonocardiaceae bacterium]